MNKLKENPNQKTKEKLEKSQYRMVGNHSAIKICYWTKKSLRNKGICYKEKFYGIPSHRCCQMTPCLICPNRCQFCWRNTDIFTEIKLTSPIDNPREMVDNAIKMQKSLINGFPGNKNININKFKEAQNPKSFAISLSGEPTLYPKLDELLKELEKRKIFSFLVTNGLFPEALKNLKTLPTQLYVSLDAPNEKLYELVDRSTMKDAWTRFNQTLELLAKLKTRTVIRITAVKNLNMTDEEGYSNLIQKASPTFVEVKGYAWLGGSRKILKEENVPSHEEVKSFAQKIARLANLKIINEKEESSVVLLAKSDFPERKLKV